MKFLIAISILVSFFLSLAFLPKWIRKCKELGLVWEDMNKWKHPKNVASSGGIVVIISFVLGVLTYIAIKTFIFKDGDGVTIEIFALLSVILLLSIVGLVDDLLGWKRGGLSIKLRLFLALAASIPLIVINAGESAINVPFFGIVNFGVFYPLILIPLWIVGAATTYNFLACMNGLEAGQGIILISFLSFVAYLNQSSWLALIGLIMVGALIAFYFFNRFPAKVFPGDILTYSVGALIACMAILGNFEKVALIVFFPYILEVILKVRGKIYLKKEFPHSFGIPDKNGSLSMPYKKVYGLTHLSILILSKFKKQVREKDVVCLIWAFQVLVCAFALVFFL